jgi:hypothetical protein
VYTVDKKAEFTSDLPEIYSRRYLAARILSNSFPKNASQKENIVAKVFRCKNAPSTSASMALPAYISADGNRT